MAVSRSVSFPDETFQQMINKGINPSKAAQLGAKIFLSGGEAALEDLKLLHERIEMKDIKIGNLEQRIANLQEELSHVRKKIVEAEDKRVEELSKGDES